MDQKSDLIKEDIEETRHDLADKLSSLEGQIRDRVENAKETVRQFTPAYQVDNHPMVLLGGTVAAGVLTGYLLGRNRVPQRAWHGTIDAAREYAPSYLSTSEYEDAGFGEGGLNDSDFRAREQQYHRPGRVSRAAHRIADAGGHLKERVRERAPEYWSSFSDQFSDEIDMVKGMALGAIFNFAQDFAKRSFPKAADAIDEVLGSAMNKVGARSPHHQEGSGWESRGSQGGGGNKQQQSQSQGQSQGQSQSHQAGGNKGAKSENKGGANRDDVNKAV